MGFKKVKSMIKSLEYLANDSQHQSDMMEVFIQLDIGNLTYDMKQNPRIAAIKKNATLTVKQALSEEKQKID